MSDSVVAPVAQILSKSGSVNYIDNDPFDLVLLSLNETILVKCRNGVEISGQLHVFIKSNKKLFTYRHSTFSKLKLLKFIRKSYDEHLNMILSDVVETTTNIVVDSVVGDALPRKYVRKMEILFVRGDAVVLISPPLRTNGAERT